MKINKALAPKYNLIGRQFGRLTVIRHAGSDKRQNSVWCCKCVCGKQVNVLGNRLRLSNGTRSCGCLHSDVARALSTKHGGSKTPEYSSWGAMIARCENRNYDGYLFYGGRGITVCKAWRESFATFLADMGKKPAGTSLDRINNNGNYEPGNCRWATPKEQASNRRHPRKRKLIGLK